MVNACVISDLKILPSKLNLSKLMQREDTKEEKIAIIQDKKNKIPREKSRLVSKIGTLIKLEIPKMLIKIVRGMPVNISEMSKISLT